MKIIEHEQGSESWLNWRKSKITATDVPVILGTNSFKSTLELWEEKLGVRQPQALNSAMQRGHDLEEEARKLACTVIGKEFAPCVIESEKYSFLGASLDGISELGAFILEIKCPKLETHLMSIEGDIPMYYQDQIQAQLLVSGAEMCYYFSFRPEHLEQQYAVLEVFPNEERHKLIIDRSQEFYLRMCTMNPPEEWIFKPKIA